MKRYARKDFFFFLSWSFRHLWFLYHAVNTFVKNIYSTSETNIGIPIIKKKDYEIWAHKEKRSNRTARKTFFEKSKCQK